MNGTIAPNPNILVTLFYPNNIAKTLNPTNSTLPPLQFSTDVTDSISSNPGFYRVTCYDRNSNTYIYAMN